MRDEYPSHYAAITIFIAISQRQRTFFSQFKIKILQIFYAPKWAHIFVIIIIILCTATWFIKIIKKLTEMVVLWRWSERHQWVVAAEKLKENMLSSVNALLIFIYKNAHNNNTRLIPHDLVVVWFLIKIAHKMSCDVFMIIKSCIIYKKCQQIFACELMRTHLLFINQQTHILFIIGKKSLTKFRLCARHSIQFQ